jgi:multiple sugar transport system permease protein
MATRRLRDKRRPAVRYHEGSPSLRHWWLPYALLSPAIFLIVVFGLSAIVGGFVVSLQGERFSSGHAETLFVGLRNYVAVIGSSIFAKSVLATAEYNLVANPLLVGSALAIGIALTRAGRLATFFQSTLLLSVCLSWTVTLLIWRSILSEGGLANGILAALNLPTQPFYTSASQALWVTVAISAWAGIGFWSLVFLGALRAINPEVIEAAALDGASAIQRFRYVVLPMMRRTLLLASVVLTASNATVFVPAQLLTLGGPDNSTHFIMYEASQKLFYDGRPGEAVALVGLLMIVVFGLVFIQFRILGSDDA